MIGRLLCAVGLHREYRKRWAYHPSTGEIYEATIGCERPRCLWTQRKEAK